MAGRRSAWALALVLAAATPAKADFWGDLDEALGLVIREKRAVEGATGEETPKQAPQTGTTGAAGNAAAASDSANSSAGGRGSVGTSAGAGTAKGATGAVKKKR